MEFRNGKVVHETQYFVSDNAGGLKGSMQHWLAVYPPEFQIPMFFVAVD